MTVPAEYLSANFTFIDDSDGHELDRHRDARREREQHDDHGDDLDGPTVDQPDLRRRRQQQAPYQNDFVELFNAGPPISLQGKSVQYASATGTTWQTLSLPNITLPTGGYALVQLAPGRHVRAGACRRPMR